jgi:hypothetical protein
MLGIDFLCLCNFRTFHKDEWPKKSCLYGYQIFLVVNTNKSIILIVAIAIKDRDPKGCQKNSYKVCPFLYKTIGKNSKILP